MNMIEKWEQICSILNLDGESFCVIRWYSPKQALPEEASYVLVKQHQDGEILCQEAAFEQGRFWYLTIDRCIPTAQVLGWAYPPYDGRADILGRLLD